MRNLFYICLICFASSLIFGHPFSIDIAIAAEQKDINSLDLFNPADRIELNSYLKKMVLLDYFAVREKLLSIPYADLNKLQEEINNEKSLDELNRLVKKLLVETEDIFTLREDIFVNNVPAQCDSPFYAGTSNSFKITDIKPHSEVAYFYNLKLHYRENRISQVDEYLWNNKWSIEQESLAISTPVEKSVYDSYALSGNAKKLWSYQLKDDYVNNYFIKLRQWIKRYEEDLVFPVISRGVAISRNEYRFIFVDILTGKEISSFAVQDTKGHEYYQTFRHPHHNSYGYEFLLSQDVLFSELNGKLVAIDLMNVLQPQLIWNLDLGEYTLCTKPVLAEKILVAGLINARGEIWVCGFNPKNGSLQWSTYIGLSSFLSPVSTISMIDGNKVFIGTNHGVLVCLDLRRGDVIWIRKYQPKKYSLFDYWHRDGYKDYFLNKGGSITYDTQFIKIEEGDNLYYKPRESDYLYILNSKNGNLKKRLLIDPMRSKIIGILNNKAIFLCRESRVNLLKAVDLSSGKELHSEVITEGVIRGVLYPSSSEILFKIGEKVYLFKNNSCKPINTPVKGWLTSQGENGRFLFVVDDRTISCLDIFKPQQSDQIASPLVVAYLSQKKQILDSLTSALNRNNYQAEELNKLLAAIISSKIPLGEIFPLLAANHKNLQHSYWKDFLIGLDNKYGNEVVTYQNIETKFSNFLLGAGFINKSNNFPIIKVAKAKDYQLKLNGETLVLPIQVIKGQKLPGAFLLLSHGQLICVDEAGEIRWERKIFFGPVWESGREGDQDRHIYAADLEVYLYNNTVIINDRINVVAVDFSNGDYMWSMTNKESLFCDEGLFPPRSSEWNYQSKKLFVKHTMFYTKFLEDRLIIIHGNRVYSLDPETGYCRDFRKLNSEGVMDVKTLDKEIFMLSYSLNNIKVLNKKLEELRDFPVNFLKESKEFWPEISFVNGYLLLHLRPELFVINANTGALLGSLSLFDLKHYYLETCQNHALIIEPLRRIANYGIGNDGIILKWEYKVDSSDAYCLWEPTARKARYYLFANGRIFFFSRSKGEYSIIAIDYTTGNQLFNKKLSGLRGPFFNLSSAIDLGMGVINFIISTVYTGDMPYQENILQKAVEAYAEETIEIDSILISLDTRNANIKKKEILPSGSFSGKGITLFKTEGSFIYGIYGSYLKAQKNN